MHPTAPPPTSAGEWAAWVIGVLIAVVVAFAGGIAYLYREARADQREHAKALRETLSAHAPTAETLAKVTTTAAVHAERLDHHEEAIEKISERVDRWEDRTPAGPKVSRR